MGKFEKKTFSEHFLHAGKLRIICLLLLRKWWVSVGDTCCRKSLLSRRTKVSSYTIPYFE